MEDPLLFLFSYFDLYFFFYFITSLSSNYSMFHVLNFPFVFVTIWIISN